MNLSAIQIPLSLKRRSARLTMLSVVTMLMVSLWPLLPLLAQEAASESSPGLFGQIQDWLVNALAWIDSLGAIAPIAFIVLYVVVTVAFVPASIVTLGAGVVFGVVKGSLLVFVGAMLGATAAFLVGRRSEERRVGKECRSRWSPYN